MWGKNWTRPDVPTHSDHYLQTNPIFLQFSLKFWIPSSGWPLVVSHLRAEGTLSTEYQRECRQASPVAIGTRPIWWPLKVASFFLFIKRQTASSVVSLVAPKETPLPPSLINLYFPSNQLFISHTPSLALQYQTLTTTHTHHEWRQNMGWCTAEGNIHTTSALFFFSYLFVKSKNLCFEKKKKKTALWRCF